VRRSCPQDPDRRLNRVQRRQGSIDRKEELLTNVAGVVTQVLPNGNLVIEGKQEVRVNYEVRELIVACVVRQPETSRATTLSTRPRSRGTHRLWRPRQLMDVQQPRYGQQVLDVLLPF